MVAGLIHRLLFPTLVTTIIGSVWIVGWSQALVAEAERGYLPAIAVPGQTAQNSDSDPSSHEANRQDGARSLDKVLLEDNQVIRVR
jgi:hypothetical protein